TYRDLTYNVAGVPDHGELRVSGRGNGCNRTYGAVRIDQATYAAGALKHLELRFEQRCDVATSPALHGELVWDADAVVPPSPNPTATVPDGLWRPAPGATPATGSYLYTASEPGDPVGEGHEVLLAGDLVGAQAQERRTGSGGTTGPLVMFGGLTSTSWVSGIAEGTSRSERLQLGYYGNLHRFGGGNQVLGGLDVSSTGSGCGVVTGWFVIDELTYVGSQITHVKLRFEQHCEGRAPALHGELLWTAAPVISRLTPATGPRWGGTVIQVQGTDLVGVTGARVGGVTASYSLDEFNNLSVVLPPLPAGVHQVVVTTAGGDTRPDPRADVTITSTPPGAPTAVTATPRSAGLAVSWSPPADHGDSPIEKVRVTAFPADDPTARTTVEVGATATSAVVDGLHPGQTYRATVAYVNADGVGPEAEPSAAVTVPAPDATPFADLGALVDQQYLDFAGRPATAGERDAAVAAMASGSVRPEAWVASMRDRAAWGGARAPVLRLYTAYFRRQPDLATLTRWSGRLWRGTTLEAISAAFASSADFRARYAGLTDAQFVDSAYRNVLGRRSDPVGRAHWKARLQAGVARSVVLTGLSESPEHRAQLRTAVGATLLYTGLMRRMPTPGELAGTATPYHVSPAHPIALTKALLHSSAYAARF
ncbi:MAG: hypothetical protein JWM05_2283, partial [Acidimicrobiales bacterium]|nr:hypothetical protein [Acidimicrobiales bacterium]